MVDKSRVNNSHDRLVFNCEEAELPLLAKNSFNKIFARLYSHLAITQLDLEKVNTRTCPAAICAKVIWLLESRDEGFSADGEYLNLVMHCLARLGDIPDEIFNQITGGLIPRMPTYEAELWQVFSIVLLDMHLAGVVTLPYKFSWPVAQGAKRASCYGDLIPDSEVYPLLLAMRGVHNKGHPLSVYSYNQKKRVASVATKMVLALGWREVSDANYPDLFTLKQYIDNEEYGKNAKVGFLVTTLKNIYPDSLPISAEGWADYQSTRVWSERRLDVLVDLGLVGEGANSYDFLNQSLTWPPTSLGPKNIKNTLPIRDGYDFEIWAKLERAFIKYAKYQGTRGIEASLGYLNSYLFIYLPGWYQKNTSCKFEFPDNPGKLIASVFVTDIGVELNEARPMTLVKWLEQLALHKGFSSARHYGILKSIERLFIYIERFNDELSGCSGFKQPLSSYDYPIQYRRGTSTKRPIPRRIFALYLQYIEAVIAYFERMQDLCLSEALSVEKINQITRPVTIDTYAVADHIGFVPIVFYKSKYYPVRYIPRLADFQYWRLKDGRFLKVAELHALYHNYVALHTGIRHQHIQWLDARTFDSENGPVLGEFARLVVNTDKVKKKPWTPDVDSTVIETLRKQLEWRQMIGEPGFSELHYYENNPDTPWPKILPLFSATKSGKPFSDTKYESTWVGILEGVNAFLIDRNEVGIRLGRYSPANVGKELGDDEFFDRCVEVTEKETKVGGRVPIYFRSEITPHSSRTSVVSHLGAYLPPDLIGRRITGQSVGTVNYYTVVDKDELGLEAKFQSKKLRSGFYEQEGYVGDDSHAKSGASRFIKADDVNSSLSKGMRKDVDAAIISFGCISLSVHEVEENGLDVLKRTRYAGAAENKTEICPYGNICPADIVTALRGIRKCAACPYAVRSVDHLPAISAKGRQVIEKLEELDLVLTADDALKRFSSEELDLMEAERSELVTEAAAWRLCEEVLEHVRQRMEQEGDSNRWVVGRPDIIEQHLKSVPFPSGEVEYVLGRLRECIEFPTLDSPLIKRQFDMLRRRILANSGNIREALSPNIPANPANECAGLIRSIMDIHGLTLDDITALVTTDRHFSNGQQHKLLRLEGVL